MDFLFLKCNPDFPSIIPEKLVGGWGEELGLLVPQRPLNPGIVISLAEKLKKKKNEFCLGSAFNTLVLVDC